MSDSVATSIDACAPLSNLLRGTRYSCGNAMSLRVTSSQSRLCSPGLLGELISWVGKPINKSLQAMQTLLQAPRAVQTGLEKTGWTGLAASSVGCYTCMTRSDVLISSKKQQELDANCLYLFEHTLPPSPTICEFFTDGASMARSTSANRLGVSQCLERQFGVLSQNF